jgi:OTT_1508-like deaminase
LDHTTELIDALQSLQKPAMAQFLRKRASDDNAGNTGPWHDLQHRSSRLLAYKRAVEVLWEAGCMWPSLFEAFEVTYISSSIRAPNPLNASPQTALEILTRMIPNSVETKGKYLDLAKTMQQKFDLDQVIENEWTSSSFRPIVHAEILVHSWLEKTGGTRPERFFNNWQYIGCSKPACKLCHYYFSTHPSGIQTRATHGNLYRNWRMPDHADVYGLRTKEEALAKRHEILQGIMSHLRQCVQRTLSEKITDSRPCDSNTISSFAGNHSRIVPEPQPWVFNEDWETMDGEIETGDGVRRSPESEASSSTN